MKIKSLCLFIIMIFTSCTPVTIYTSTPSDNSIATTVFPTPIPTITPVTYTPTPEIPTITPISVQGFSMPDPNTWVMLMPVVREYFYYRQKAITSNNIEELWTHYPELKNGIDVDRRINAEEFFVSNYQGLKPFDGNFFSEQYERLRVKLENDKAEIYVHGMELLLWIDQYGNFQDSGGEIKIILFVKKQDNRWIVYKTDQIGQHEQNPFSP